MSFSNFTPKLLTDFKGKTGLEKLFLNEWLEAGITKDGEVYVWDAHRLSSYEIESVDDGKRENIQKLKLVRGVLCAMSSRRRRCRCSSRRGSRGC